MAIQFSLQYTKTNPLDDAPRTNRHTTRPAELAVPQLHKMCKSEQIKCLYIISIFWRQVDSNSNRGANRQVGLFLLRAFIPTKDITRTKI